ncbi:MAG: helix-turn-helix domain-containing protein [Haloarculaceae archaeon]
MAIPTWRWNEDAAASGGVAGAGSSTDGSSATATGASADESTDSALDRVDVDGVSNTFETLADPTRLAILAAVADHEGPLSYTDLREAAAVEDNGRLNFHLRRLDGLVADGDDGYELTVRGRRLFRRLIVGKATVES